MLRIFKMKPGPRGALITLIIEVLSIVLGVLLALGVAEWRENRIDDQLAAHAQESILREIEANIEMLEQRLPYYRNIHETLDSMIVIHGDKQSLDGLDIPGWRGLAPALMRSSSWEAALSTQALQVLNFNLVDSLSSHYSFQKLYLGTQEVVLHHAMIGASSITLDQLSMNMQEFHQLGGELLFSCRQIRTVLDRN